MENINEFLPTKIESSEQKTSKELLGEEFTKILKNEAVNFDKNIFELASMVSGEESAKAMRNSSILRGALLRLVESPYFPKEKVLPVQLWVNQLVWEDPSIERQSYYNAETLEEKKSHAEQHNEKYALYTSAIKALFEELKEILPDDIVHELWAQNTMFVEILALIDKEHADGKN